VSTAKVGSTASSYEILSKLAEGGMAEIYLARVATTAGIHRHVVLKRILRERATDTQFVRMFLDEAKLAAQLQHPNIAQVFDVGRLGASYFFTMEYVHGVTVQTLLERALARSVPVPIGAVLSIVAGAAAGLGHAHQRVGIDGRPLGIVHRDVSPSNLMVSFEGNVKVVDFGVAKAVGRPETMAGEIKGKVGYLSPEQCRQHKLDSRSDLFSLGIVTWELLTARRLFRRDTAFETMAVIATEAAPPPSTWRPDIPPEVDALVHQLLALEPADRYQTAERLIEALETVALSTKSALSPAAPARLLRELFGLPPEPWLSLEREVVTVAAAAIPEELVALALDDPELADVEVKLTSEFGAVTPLPLDDDEFSRTTNIRRAAAPPADITRVVAVATRETVRMPHVPGELADDLTPDPPTEVRGSIAPRARLATRPPPIRSPSQSSPPPPRAQSRSSPPPLRSPIATTTLLGSGPVAASGPRPLAFVPPSGPNRMPFVPPSQPRAPQPAGRQSLRWWIAGGSLLGVALTFLIVIASGDDTAEVTVATPDARVVVVAPIDAMVDARLDAPTEPLDAPVDAAEQDDLAELAAEPPEDPRRPVTPARPRLRTKADLNRAYRARRFKDIVAACGQLGSDGERAVVCTLAACQMRSAVAQDWYRNVEPHQREGTINICRQAGAKLEDICLTDLTACRR